MTLKRCIPVALAWRSLVQGKLPSTVQSTHAQSIPKAFALSHNTCASSYPAGTRILHNSVQALDAPSTSSSFGGLGAFLKGKLYQSSFLSQFFPGGMASKEPEKEAKTKQQEAPTSEADKANEQIEKMANMTLEGYAHQCRVRCSQDGPGKRLRLPPVPMSHPDFRKFIDFNRVIYLRLKQHDEIINLMTREQIQFVEQNKHLVLQDKAFLAQVAKQSLIPASGASDPGQVGGASSRGEYIPDEVKDCIKSWLDLRRHGRFMQYWVSVMGKDVNAPDQEMEQGKKDYDAYEAVELHSRMLSGRDTANCALRKNLGFTGKHTSCSLTGLPYMNCCGGKPFSVAIAKKMLEGRNFDEARTLVEVAQIQGGSRMRTRQPFNHLMPKPEGFPRQMSHDRTFRKSLRYTFTPRFEKNGL